MIRVIGDVELYVGVDWPTRTVRVQDASGSQSYSCTPECSAALRANLSRAERYIEGDASSLPGSVGADVAVSDRVWVDATTATITVASLPWFTVVESEHLRYLLARVESALATGVGDIGL